MWTTPMLLGCASSSIAERRSEMAGDHSNIISYYYTPYYHLAVNQTIGSSTVCMYVLCMYVCM